MTNTDLISYIDVLMKSESNPCNALKMARYMKNYFEFYGVRASERNEILRNVKFKCKSFDIDRLISFAKASWNHNYREMHYIAIDLLKWKMKYLTSVHLHELEHLLTHNSWWDSVDIIASNLVGTVLSKNKKEQYEWSEKWINSDDMWLRRTALLHQLKYRNQVDAELLFSLVESQIGSNQFFINKACGWALRQYSKYNPVAVSQFISTHPNLSNLTIKEASKYIR